jgi:outer membrane protein assembly factor BamE (lipoprotein component of BamABCDE complex)
MTKSNFFLLFALVAFTLTACAPTKATRGNIVDDYRMAEVVPGTSTQSDVIRVLGSPTAQDPFDPSIWYYIGQKTEKKGILDPKVTEEKIVRATFDPATGVLKEIARIDNSRNNIPISKRKTPTSGNEMTAVQQVLGNLGKFNKPEGSTQP